MDAHTLVLLMRPADPPQLDEAAVDALQEQHLAFLQARRDDGVMAAAGPFHDRPDQRWRGMCIYLVDREQGAAAGIGRPDGAGGMAGAAGADLADAAG
jgi:uncharacterized protein YciI